MTQQNEKNRVVCVLMVVALLACPMRAVAQEVDGSTPSLPPDADVRAVVDISGSMKETDPNNLRQPAVRMLARMLPEGSRGGVWTFGKYVNMLVPSGQVTPEWREQAIARSEQINSVALRTNIGEALEVASDDFYGDRRFENTHFILLTDGKVDIADDPDANASERERILKDVVARIRERGADIHTIALSQNSDRALMEQLAVRTGGSFTVAEDSEALNRLFAETLNTTAPQTEVPIEGNEFQVDDGVSEFTALIFHDTSSGLKMRRPDGMVLDQAVASDQVNWAVEGPYDLITIQDPMPGRWQIEGDLSEDSRVTVVSDLKMAVSDLPAFFYKGQDVVVETAFYEEGQPITDPDFLSVIDLSLRLTTEDGRSGEKNLSGETPPRNGVYTDTLSTLSQPGTYTLTLLADGKTFSRKAERKITLRPPVSIEMAGKGSGDQTRYRLSVSPEHPDLDTAATEVQVAVKALESEKPAVRTIAYDKATGSWSTAIESGQSDGDYQVAVRVVGETAGGSTIDYTSAPLVASFPRTDDNGAGYATPKPAKDDKQAPLPGDLSEKAIDPPVPDDEPESSPEKAESEPAPASDPSTDNASDPVESAATEADASESPEPSDEPENETSTPSEDDPLMPFWGWVAAGVAGALIVVGGAVMVARRRKHSDEDGSTNDEEPPVISDTPETEEDESLSEEPDPEPEPEPEPEQPPEADEPEPASEATEPEAGAGETPADEPDSGTDGVPEEASEEEASAEEPPTVSEEVEDSGEFDDSTDAPAADEPAEQAGVAESDEPEPPVASETVGESEQPAADPERQADAPTAEADVTAGDVDELDRMLRDNEEDDTLLDTDEEGNVEEFGLEDFDLSDIDDLPDLDDDESKSASDETQPGQSKTWDESNDGEEPPPSRNN
ncbi:uncharacterized protein (TIGR03503 family) [Tamilnaduibacter salinus]|uniref:Uncharacterized protein (TIGR03503 family) n=1 Tax=Tamilnaduibacter salinus TaxID=1484056 RepID=A0A2U1CZS5_9GAMM|nr:VWA domain-containing protein [Tamilnaduibacter salinus]PVY78289.1 uncharacterized protein (TIGR03503 family) [Tamilnaduibacter salinus]